MSQHCEVVVDVPSVATSTGERPIEELVELPAGQDGGLDDLMRVPLRHPRTAMTGDTLTGSVVDPRALHERDGHVARPSISTPHACSRALAKRSEQEELGAYLRATRDAGLRGATAAARGQWALAKDREVVGAAHGVVEVAEEVAGATT